MISTTGIPSPVAAELSGVQETTENCLPQSSERNEPASQTAAQVVKLIGKIVAVPTYLSGPVSIDYSYKP
jgi:hypothetical protein